MTLRPPPAACTRRSSALQVVACAGPFVPIKPSQMPPCPVCNTDQSLPLTPACSMLLNPLAGATRRISLDNSALDRRRWEIAAAAAAAAAANNDSTLSPMHPSSAHSSAAGDLMSPAVAAAGTAALAAPAPASGGWQPELAVIHSDGSHEGSQRSSAELGPGGGAGAAWPPLPLSQLPLHPLQPVQEHEEGDAEEAAAAPGPAGQPSPPASAFAAAASAAAPAVVAAGAGAAASKPAPPALRILVAEDNMINQRVISKVHLWPATPLSV